MQSYRLHEGFKDYPRGLQSLGGNPSDAQGGQDYCGREIHDPLLAGPWGSVTDRKKTERHHHGNSWAQTRTDRT